VRTIMVIGANGFLGSSIVNYFGKKHKVIALFNKHILRFPGTTHFNYNLSDRDYMKRIISLTKPDTIIYCAGINDFVECAKNQRMAEAVNSYGPTLISSAADTVQHRFIYLSTAFVYDGKRGNYLETDVVLPQSAFGKYKLAGENYVRSKFMTYTVMRLSPVYGLGTIYHPSQFDQIRMKLQRGERVELPQNEMHSFLFVDIAMRGLEWVITQESRNRTYNLGGLTKVTWFDFGKLIAESFGFNPDLVMPAKGNFEEDVDFSLNGTDLVRLSQVDPLIMEQGLDLLKQQLIRR